MRWTATPQSAQALILELNLAACSYSLNKSVHLQQHLSTQTTHGALDQTKGDYNASIPPRKSKSSPIIPQWQQLSTICSYRLSKISYFILFFAFPKRSWTSIEKVSLPDTPAPAGPYYGAKAGRCKKVLSWPTSGDKRTRCKWDLVRSWARKGGWQQLLLLGAKKVTGSWVNFYHAQPMGSTFRRDIRVLHGHPGRWPTLWSPLRNPSPQHPLMSQPPSPPQHPPRPVAAPSSLDPCPGRLAQPRLSRNDYR